MASETPSDPSTTSTHLICTACGTQFPTSDHASLKSCFICDDPRQFTPQSGQSFTSLASLRSSSHHNTFTPFPGDNDDTFTSIVTEPKFAIGQRAILIKTPRGNVLWDCITLLDAATIAQIKELGGLKAIVISHPHYYTTHAEWARAFSCPVYLAAEDKAWTTKSSPHQVFMTETELALQIDGAASGIQILKLGGHFPGSLVALYRGRLLVADTLVTTPAGLGNWDVDALGNARARPPNMSSFAFMWSIPNMVPLGPDELERMWGVLKKYEFRSTHGAFLATDIMKTEAEMRRRVLESIQMQVRYMGYGVHALLKENSA